MEIEVSAETALVLFDRISRWEEVGYPSGVDSPAESAMTELLGELEARLVEPLLPDYNARVGLAEEALVERTGKLDAPNIQQVVVGAVEELLATDGELITIECHERTIAHRLAVYIEKRVRGWTVDCEYNRKGDEIKRLVSWNALLEQQGLEPVPDADRQYVNPDIIVHRRQTQQNLLVVEVKTSWSRSGQERDVLKLEAMRWDLGYEHAAYVEFGPSADAGAKVVWV